MILDDVRDKTLELLQTIKGQLDESDAYIQLKERYDSLSPFLQKVVVGFAGAVFAFVLFQFPLGYYNTSSENIALFEENRDLVLDLYSVKRRSQATPAISPPLEASALESRARSAVTSARVQADQIKGVSFFDNAGPASSSFIPKSVTQSGVEIRLANLNLNQIVEIGHSLSNLGSMTKITGLEVRPGLAPGNYFDATFKVVSFNVSGEASK